MLQLLSWFFFLWAKSDFDEIERSRERRAERRRQEQRHSELMEALRQERQERGKRKVTRTYARDEQGRCVAQEIVEEDR